jgi:hypothetical protein
MRFQLNWDSGSSSFALSSDYIKNQLEEILYLVKRGFSYRDSLTMPVYVRRFYVTYMLEKENEIT